MFTVELPYNIGTFVKVKTENGKVDYYGTVAAYTVSQDGYLIWVSGYKEAITGEYLPEEVELMSDKEIKSLMTVGGFRNENSW